MANKTVTVKSSGGDYTSLNAALAGESTDLVNTLDGILTIECYAMEDTTPATTGTGYTTDADHYINIVVPAAERHGGTRNAAKYRLDGTKTYGSMLGIDEAYTRVTGLQIKNAGTSSANGIGTSAGGTYCVFDSVLIYDSPCTGGYGILAYSGGNAKLINCVIANIGTTGLYCKGALAYNCAIVNCGAYGFLVATYATLTAKNCYAGGCGTADYALSGTGSVLTDTTCFSEDGSEDVPTAAFATDSGCYFTNVTAGSENLATTSTSSSLYNAGTDLHADATWPFSVDIAGTARPNGAWDVGAFEYVAAGGLTVMGVANPKSVSGVVGAVKIDGVTGS